MSGLGGNLNYKDRPVLINNLSVKDFGTYKETDPDSGAVSKHLVVKAIGLDLAFDPSVRVQVSRTQDGALKSVLLALQAPVPCQQCNYEYGISVIKRVRQPGVLNDDVTVRERFYGGVLEAVQPSAGPWMTDADKLAMEGTILAAIALDRGLGTREEAVVDGRRLYIVNVTAVSTQTLTITDASGAETIALDGGTTVQKMVHDINNDNTKGILAFGLGAGRIAVTTTEAGKLFTLANGGGAGLGELERYLWVTARGVEAQFEVRFDPGYLTLARFNVIRITNAYTSAGPGNYFAVDGLKNATAATGALASHTYAASIVTQCSSLGIYATAAKEANGADVWVYSGIKQARVVSLSNGIAVHTHYCGPGRYPSLTWEDVFREFVNKLHLNGLTHLVPLGQPSAGSRWNKVVITRKNTIASQHGANHGNDYLQVQTLFLRQGSGAAALWHDPDQSGQNAAGMWESAADNALFSATKNINELLVAWGSTASLPNPGIL